MKTKLITTIIIILSLITTIGYAQIVPTPNPVNNNQYCVGTTVVYGDNPLDPNATYTFDITPPVPFTLNTEGNQMTVTWLNDGTYTITITKTDNCGTVQSSVNIIVNPALIAQIPLDTLCVGNNQIILTALPLGVNPVFTGTGIINGNTFDATGLPPGDYIINFTSTDVNGCPITGQTTITVLPLPPPPIIHSNQ
jgi:hypothetical protein